MAVEHRVYFAFPHSGRPGLFLCAEFAGALVSVVSMVRRSSVIVSFIFGAIIFSERNLKSKALDLLLVLLGMVCIWIGTHA